MITMLPEGSWAGLCWPQQDGSGSLNQAPTCPAKVVMATTADGAHRPCYLRGASPPPGWLER